jgi:hypothetical protein
MRWASPFARAFTRTRLVSGCAVVAAALFTSACSTLQVRTLGAPDANFVNLRTFRILEVPAPIVIDAQPAWSDEPMLNNSITYRAGLMAVRAALEMRGFVYDEQSPDFHVAFYASAQEKLDLNDWGYGYGYGYCCGPYITEYTEGTVIIDVVDPASNQLIWRGSGVADVSDKPEKYMRQQQKAIVKIVERFPTGYPPNVVVLRR